MADFFIFGLGYAARFVAAKLVAAGWAITGTGTAAGNLIRNQRALPFEDTSAVYAALARASHVLSSVPPEADGSDPVLARYGHALAGKWLGYLSSTGVYGDTGGAWVDETAPTGQGRRTARVEADSAWIARRARVFRLPGIYGPGRSAFDRLRAGNAHRIALPGQVFSRVHVDDIAGGVCAALDAPPGAYNLADDLPAPQTCVIEEAARLIGLPPPPLQSVEEAGLSPAARAFYAENRRVANGKAKRVLGWQPRHPTYHEGLRAIRAAEQPEHQA